MNPPFDIESTLATLTLEEKASLLSGHHDWWTAPVERPADGVHVPSIEVGDGPHGLRKETGVDMVWIPATAFPTASAMGASWDRELVCRVGRALGQEARAQGVQVLLGPGVNMKRSPLCGRNFEYFSEDPVLSGELGAAYVRGVQSTGVGTSLKHFAANNQETERTRISVHADERTLREVYLPAFERVVVAANPTTVMCSYNRLNDVHTSQHHWLLTEVLRRDWGYQGAVVSDWNAVHDRVAALRAGLDLEMPGTSGRTDAEVVAAVRAGDLGEHVVDAAARRVLQLVLDTYPGPEHVVGEVVRGGVEPGAALTETQLLALSAREHHRLAREAARGCITLLRNGPDGQGRPVLPLDEASSAKVAVIGAFAEHARVQGGGSSGVQATFVDQPLDLLRAALPGRVTFAPGYVHTPKNPYEDDLPAWFVQHGWTPPAGEADGSRRSSALAEGLRLAAIAREMQHGPLSLTAQRLIDGAVDAATDADVIVVFVGLPLFVEQEADDRRTLSLPADQVVLLTRLAEVRRTTGAPVVVVLNNGSPVSMDPWHDGVDAIVEAWLPGQAGAGAVVDVLLGRSNPSGKTAETFPVRTQDIPNYATWRGERGVVTYGEGVFVGYRWYDGLNRDVLYPFGHGLSYTTFSYRDLVVDVIDEQAGSLRVSCVITNVGPRSGQEVVQLYVGDPESVVSRPVRELKGFDKITLEPGESKRVVFELSGRDFAYWDSALLPEEDPPSRLETLDDGPNGRLPGWRGGWRREGGTFRLEVGASSRDIRLVGSIVLPDDPTVPPVRRDSDLVVRAPTRFTGGHTADVQ